MAKRKVLLEVYKKDAPFSIEGRCIGFLDPDTYTHTLRDETLLRKIITSETITAKELLQVPKIEGYRLGIVVDKIDDNEPETKKVFFTEPLDYLTEEMPESEAISFVSKKGTVITLSRSIAGGV